MLVDEIKLEDNIPVPEIGDKRTGKWVHLFRRMQAGQSFVLPVQKLQSVRYCAIVYRKRHDQTFKYAARKISDTEGRFWKL